MSELIRELVRASEKGANLARAIRKEQKLFALLVQEKKDGEKNKRFIQDFKTLADVLIQETVRHDISAKFPKLAPHVNGEESNTFTNIKGESITVQIQMDKKQTAKLLEQVLDNNMAAAEILANTVHREIDFEMDQALEALDVKCPVDNLAIWIDPLDSTAEYISGKGGLIYSDGIAPAGLQCVTVLIGVYNQQTGEPLIGVINQPFHTFNVELNRWVGKYYWGYHFDGQRASSLTDSFAKPSTKRNNEKMTVLISGAEDQSLKAVLSESYHLMYTAGAGYKQLCVALGLADGYILSRDTTFRWDCCAPHALLKSIGGGVVNFRKLVSAVDSSTDSDSFAKELDRFQMTYNSKVDDAEGSANNGIKQWCNKGGLIAYKDVNVLKELIQTIQPALLTHL